MDDVLILGSGLGGSMLAACLAVQGLAVRVLDAAVHPRFAIGEATTPDSSFRLKLLGLRYGVPEIGQLGAFHRLRDSVGPSSGLKRGFSFVYHRPGQPADWERSHQYPTFAPPMGPDCHLFRQDTDAFMMAAAMRYGAEVQQGTRAEDIRFDDQGVTVETDRGETLRARFLVDAAGFGSPLARQLGLRDNPPCLETDSRAIFTHMLGVPPLDDLCPPVRSFGLPYPLGQTSLHHVFEGGWMWVIPFNNHPDAVNPLCSLGLCLDRGVFGQRGTDPEAELRQIAGRYPTIARQLEGARAVRPWVSTGRIQQTCRQMVGDRWALTAHAAGFVDPLYSSGLALTAAVTDQLAARLLAACDDDRFERERFLPVEETYQENLSLFDRMVANSYRAWGDWDLWDAWYRLWVIGLLMGTAVNGNLYMRWLEEGDSADFGASLRAPTTGLLGSALPPCRDLLDGAFAEFDRLEEGATPERVADRIRGLFPESPCSPDYWRWEDPSVRTTPVFTVGGMLRLWWSFRRGAPESLRRHTFDWGVGQAMGYLWEQYRGQRRAARRRSGAFLRDALIADTRP